MTDALAAGPAGMAGGGGGAPRRDRRRSEVAATLEPSDDEAVEADLGAIWAFGGGGDADLKDRGGSEEDPNPKSRRFWEFIEELGSGRDFGFLEDFLVMAIVELLRSSIWLGKKYGNHRTFAIRNEIES